LSAASVARAADAPAWKIAGATAAAVGYETVFVYAPPVAPGAKLVADTLASATTGFAIVKAEALPDGTWAWTLLPLDEGKKTFVARWTLDGKPFAAPAVEIPVSIPKLPSDADIADIKGPIAARRAWWPWLLAAALGALAWEAWRRWKAARAARPLPLAPVAPPLTPDEAAERALAELEASGLWARGEHPAFYLRLTDILRVYLEARWGEPATAMTSAEVARLIKDRHADFKLAAQTRELLQRADLVKFARLKGAAEDGPADAQLVRALVVATTPRPAAAAAEETTR
jgi:hypothetical protein